MSSRDIYKCASHAGARTPKESALLLRDTRTFCPAAIPPMFVAVFAPRAIAHADGIPNRKRQREDPLAFIDIIAGDRKSPSRGGACAGDAGG